MPICINVTYNPLLSLANAKSSKSKTQKDNTKEQSSLTISNNPRSQRLNLASQAMRKTPEVSQENEPVILELALYEASTWWSTDEVLLKKHGPLLFFKENETVTII